MHKHGLRNIIAALIPAAMIISGLPAQALAEDAGSSVARTGISYSLYEECGVYSGGELLFCAKKEYKGSGIYFPLKDICAAFLPDAEVSEHFSAGTVFVTGAKLELSADISAGYITANDRYLYSKDSVRVIDGAFCLSLDLVRSIFGNAFTADEKDNRVDVNPDEISIIYGVPEYYELRYSSGQDLYWLSRIIYSEASGTSLSEQIAVGNVVMNRVADEIYFADNIKDVIFEEIEGVIQFSPVEAGGIYLEPDEQSLIAAYICLEGCNLIGDAEYFVSNVKGDVSWFRSCLELVAVYGTHEFYRDPRY